MELLIILENQYLLVRIKEKKNICRERVYKRDKRERGKTNQINSKEFNNGSIDSNTGDASSNPGPELYFNTSNNVMMVYTGSAWVRTTPTSSNQTNINTVAGIASDVTSVSGINTDVTSVAGITSDVTAVAGKATEVGIVSGKVAEVKTVADDLNNGSFIDINNNNLTRFAFKRTDINLDKYSSKSTKTPKFQELSTINLISCLYKLNYNIILSKIPTYFQCESKAENDIDEELFKRIIKPFFIPSIVLIACLIILSSKDSYKYSRLQYILFIVGFLIIVTSEITARYIGNSKIEFFIILPLITFLISYLFFMLKLRVSK